MRKVDLPSPCGIASSTAHLRDQRREKSVDSTGDDTGRKEVDIACKILALGVVCADQIGTARDEGRFSEASEQTANNHFFPSLDISLSDDCDAPKEHHDTEGFWPIMLERNLKRNTSNKVAKVKDPHTDVEALADEVQLLLHARDFRISNVGAGELS